MTGWRKWPDAYLGFTSCHCGLGCVERLIARWRMLRVIFSIPTAAISVYMALSSWLLICSRKADYRIYGNVEDIFINRFSVEGGLINSN